MFVSPSTVKRRCRVKTRLSSITRLRLSVYYCLHHLHFYYYGYNHRHHYYCNDNQPPIPLPPKRVNHISCTRLWLQVRASATRPPTRTKHPKASYHRSLFFIMAQHLDSRFGLLQDRSTFGAGSQRAQRSQTKTRLESRFCNKEV